MLVFSWQALHNSLPVAEVLGHRGIPISYTCRLCSVHDETQMHCLRDCLAARNVWNNLALSVAPGFFPADSMEAWLDSVSRLDVVTLLVHAWYIWCSRCDYVFNHVQTPWQIVLQQAVVVLCVLRGPSECPSCCLASVGGLARSAGRVGGAECGWLVAGESEEGRIGGRGARLCWGVVFRFLNVCWGLRNPFRQSSWQSCMASAYVGSVGISI